MMLYFHDLQPAPEGTQLVSIPPELAALVARRDAAFLMVQAPPEPTVPVVGFVARGPEPGDRYGLMVRQDLLVGTLEQNADAIRRTMPDGWKLSLRTRTL